MNQLLVSRGFKPRKGRVVKCAHCGNDFYAYPSRVSSKFCSIKCAQEVEKQKSNFKKVECYSCGKDILRRPSEMRFPYNYCSQKCFGFPHKRTEETRVTPRSEVGRKGKRMRNGLWSTKKADREFSLYIRNRDDWTCVFCKKKYPPNSQGLQNSHFWGRGNSSTRYDPKNCDALCAKCHFTHEGSKQGFYRQWKLNQLGVEGYRLLMNRSYKIVKRSDAIKELMIWITLPESVKN